MIVSLGSQEGMQSNQIPPDNISVAFMQSAERTGQRLHIYFMDVDKKVGRIELSPFEFRKIMHQGQALLVDNKVRE